MILSPISATKDGRVNARAIDINGHIEQCCARNGWLFMDNKNITTADLRAQCTLIIAVKENV